MDDWAFLFLWIPKNDPVGLWLEGNNATMQELLPNIFKVYRDKSSGGWGYSYFVKRPEGNLLLARMARSASIENEYAEIETRGGLSRIYITDFHFAGDHVQDVATRFNVPVYCSRIESPKIKSRGVNNVATFEYRVHDIEPNLTVIPTPGHTSGGVCYLLTMDGTRYLFTGDLLYFDGSEWVLGSDYATIKSSLDRLQAMEFDYLIGCGEQASGSPYITFTPDTKKAFFENFSITN